MMANAGSSSEEEAADEEVASAGLEFVLEASFSVTVTVAGAEFEESEAFEPESWELQALNRSGALSRAMKNFLFFMVASLDTEDESAW